MKRARKSDRHPDSGHGSELHISPFLEGIGSLMDMFGNSSDSDDCFIRDDGEALASDWKKVGQDMWQGFNFR